MNSSPERPMRFILLVPVGPRPCDVIGVSELCEGAVAHSEGADLEIWCLNDGNDPAVLAAIAQRHRLAYRILPHPFAGRGNHWLGRLTAGLVHGMRLIAAERPDDWHVLRMDTDALIVGPWERRLFAIAQDKRYGLIGSNELGNEGRQMRGDWWGTRLYRHSKWISRADHGPGMRVAWRRSSRILTRTIRTAFAQGGRNIRNINGGIYLMPAHALACLNGLPLFQPELCFQINSFTEDVVMGLCVHAAGLKFLLHNNPGDTIASSWQGLAAPTLPALVASGCGLIHSIKDHSPFREEETRAFFRARRQSIDH